MSRRVAWFSFKRGQGAEACPEPSIYDSFFITTIGDLLNKCEECLEGSRCTLKILNFQGHF